MAPLAVSAPRGVAATFTIGLRAHTIDLEEHEGDDVEDDEGSI